MRRAEQSPTMLTFPCLVGSCEEVIDDWSAAEQHLLYDLRQFPDKLNHYLYVVDTGPKIKRPCHLNNPNNTHTHTLTHTHARTHTDRHTHIRAHTHICAHTHMHTHSNVTFPTRLYLPTLLHYFHLIQICLSRLILPLFLTSKRHQCKSPTGSESKIPLY